MTRITLLLLSALAGGAQFAEGQAVPRAVSGRVFDDTTGCPLAGVQIQAAGGTGRVLTNTQGRYRLVGLPDGDVIVQAAKAGYVLSRTLPMTVPDSSARADFSLLRAVGDSASRAAYPRKACQLEPPDR